MITPSQTTSQERYVVGFSLVAGLIFFGWLSQHHQWNWRHGRNEVVIHEGASPVIHHGGALGASPAAVIPQDVVANQAWLVDRVDRAETDLSDLNIVTDDRMAELERVHVDDVSNLTEAEIRQQNSIRAAIEQSGEINASQGVRLDRLESATKDPEIALLKLQIAKLDAQRAEQARIDAERIRLLELQFSRIRNATAQSRLFVEGDNLGDARATALFSHLKKIDATGAVPDMDFEYLRIGEELKSSPIVRIKYETAGSEVQEKDRQLIEKLAESSPAGTYFLVAGYADTTGDAEINRVLSSKRATNAAEILDQLTKADQTVRAVYLGQTRRFGAEAENRVVEIWAIKP